MQTARSPTKRRRVSQKRQRGTVQYFPAGTTIFGPAVPRDLADQLQTFNRDGALISWEMDADVLTQAQAQVNAMDEELCRLRLIRRVTLPWQQKAIDRVAPKMIELTDYVEDALQNLNEKHNTVNTLDRSFAQDADFMYRRADTIARSIGNFEEYAAARTEIQQLSPKLGMHAGS